jgi:hypothetical protein
MTRTHHIITMLKTPSSSRARKPIITMLQYLAPSILLVLGAMNICQQTSYKDGNLQFSKPCAMPTYSYVVPKLERVLSLASTKKCDTQTITLATQLSFDRYHRRPSWCANRRKELRNLIISAPRLQVTFARWHMRGMATQRRRRCLHCSS